MWNIRKEDVFVKDNKLPFKFESTSDLLTSPDHVVIDSYDAQPFNRNDCGWIRNDISQLMRAQSQEEYNMLLHKLEVTNDTGSLPKGMKREDAIKRIKPRYAQSQVELQQYAEYLAGLDSARLDEAYARATENKIEQKVEQPAVEQPA